MPKFLQKNLPDLSYNPVYSPSGRQARAFVGTYHLHDAQYVAENKEVELDLPFQFDSSTMLSLDGQYERAPQTGSIHAHFLVRFIKPQTEGAARRLLRFQDRPAFTHYLKPARSVDASKLYVTEVSKRLEDTVPFHYGVGAIGQGASATQLSATEMALAGAAPHEIMRAYPDAWNRHHAGLSKIIAIHQKERMLDHPPTVVVLYGITGSGKSHYVNEGYPNAFRKIGDPKWWDGYNGQHTVVMEEFNPDSIGRRDMRFPIEEMLKLCDKYGYKGQVKGGSTEIYCDTIVFTSNIPPTDWFMDAPREQRLAFFRRITQVLYFPKRYNPKFKKAYYEEVVFAIPGVPESLDDEVCPSGLVPFSTEEPVLERLFDLTSDTDSSP